MPSKTRLFFGITAGVALFTAVATAGYFAVLRVKPDIFASFSGKPDAGFSGAAPSRSDGPDSGGKNAAGDPSEARLARDQQRFSDVNGIRIGLLTHKAVKKTYPDKLAELLPASLKSLPKDPTTGQDYGYALTDKGYEIFFTLEGMLFGMAAGDHVLTPLGYDPPGDGETPGPPPRPDRPTAPRP